MATAHVTGRDVEMFSALDRCPLTVRQLRLLSLTFAAAFGSDRRLQDRLALLARAGLLRRFRYASTEGSGQFYYTLSPESYRLLHGPDAILPTSGVFQEIGVARQLHSMRLADFIVHTRLAAFHADIPLADFHRENQLRLTLGPESLYPDCSFTLTAPGRPPFLFYVELDNSTEPLTSPKERDSWQRKLRLYEALQDAAAARFRVLGLVTRSQQRLTNIAALAAGMTRNPHRSLFYGVYLPTYLASPTPLTLPLFTDHRGGASSLLPAPLKLDRTPKRPRSLAEPVLT